MKIFGIGLSKTGTTSLFEAMRILGYSSKHYLQNPDIQIKAHDFLCDMPIQTRYHHYDNCYLNSKFILTIRDKKSWLKSCFYHFRHHSNNSQQLSYRIEQMGVDKYDEVIFSKAYDNHFERAKNYFKDRQDDFLIIDICNGQGWDVLCSFLDKKKPSVPFPFLNSSKHLYFLGLILIPKGILFIV